MTEPIAHTVRGAWTPGTHPLSQKVLRRLRSRTGLRDVHTPAVPEAELVVPESGLPAAAASALAGLVGAEHVRVDRESRLGRAGGLSYLDLLRYRTGAGLVVPDAVVLPGDPAEVASVVRACVQLGVGVVPFGGGTSVVGGVAPLRGDKSAVVALDLVRLDELVSLDPVSRMAVLQAGVRGPEAERLLGERGFTLGHYPQSFERATIGGFAATRSAGQASAGYGRFEDMVVGLRLATPRGEWRLGVAPASAAGPDLRAVVVGSEGAFGIVTEVTVRVRPASTRRRYEAYAFNGWQRGVAAVRALAQGDALATVTRLSDMEETDIALVSAGGAAEAALRGYLRVRGVREPCLLIVGWEARSARELTRMRARTRRVLRAAKPVALGRRPGDSWVKGRFGGPRQRDALLDVGVCVETLETAGYWSALGALRDRVRTALRDTLPGAVVMCHLSHAYETGASLYFTVLAPRNENAISQWHRAKDAASRAIVAEPAGTITHHHAVGVDHKPYLEAEIGEVGAEVLAAIKQVVDPTGIMNPGKLIPADGDAE